ncbi:MAG: V-type ATP synthase subunit E [Deinococcaceae bacterium]
MADLATLLKNEVQNEIEAIKNSAKQQAEQILAQAKEDAQSLIEGRKRALENQLQAGLVRAKSAAELEASALRLAAAEEGLSQAFSEAKNRMRSFTQNENYKNILGKLALEAKATMAEVETVEVAPNDLEVARAAMAMVGIYAPVKENPKIETGIRLIGPNGRSGVTNTLLERMDRVRDSLAPIVAKMLRE